MSNRMARCFLYLLSLLTDLPHFLSSGYSTNPNFATISAPVRARIGGCLPMLSKRGSEVCPRRIARSDPILHLVVEFADFRGGIEYHVNLDLCPHPSVTAVQRALLAFLFGASQPVKIYPLFAMPKSAAALPLKRHPSFSRHRRAMGKAMNDYSDMAYSRLSTISCFGRIDI